MARPPEATSNAITIDFAIHNSTLEGIEVRVENVADQGKGAHKAVRTTLQLTALASHLHQREFLQVHQWRKRMPIRWATVSEEDRQRMRARLARMWIPPRSATVEEVYTRLMRNFYAAIRHMPRIRSRRTGGANAEVTHLEESCSRHTERRGS